MTRRASAASRLIWASSSLSAAAASMPDPPATIKVSTGPVTSAMADEANSSPQLARTGPPVVVTTSGAVPDSGQEARGAGEDLERSGDVEDLGGIEGHDDHAPSTGGHDGSARRGCVFVDGSSGVHGLTVRRGAVAEIVNNVSLWPARRAHTLKS